MAQQDLPMPVQTGTDHYYQDRLADFERRNPEADPPSYYADYGDRCLHQFRRAEPSLTEQGQEWLQRTLVDLQERLEQRCIGDPAGFGRLEQDSDAFEKMAFNMHSDAYLSSGIADLPVSDLLKIVNTPDVADLITAQGLKEIFEVIAGADPNNNHTLAARVVGVVRQSVRRVSAAISGGRRSH